MREVQLQVEHRSGRGKGPARQLRAAGKVPATMYGGGGEPVALAVNERALDDALSTDAGINALLDLMVDGETHLAMARELSRDPIRGSIIHVDFLRIDRTVAITVDVPIHLDGEPHGVKEGGVVEHHLWQLHIECLPGNVPEHIDIDVSGLGIGESVRVSDLSIPEGVTVLSGADEIVASVIMPQVLEVEAPAEAVEGEEIEGEAAEGEAPEGAAEEQAEQSDEG